ADRTVPYGRVMEVMSSLQAAGMDSVGLITEAPDEL
ncbi:MAG: biopolymer transport protein TolR, partial [Reinekea sp.]